MFHFIDPKQFFRKQPPSGLPKFGALRLTAAGPASAQDDAARDRLIRLAHKIAGTAAMFGEAELGTAAAALERALVRRNSVAVCRSIAKQLLALADGEGLRRTASRTRS